MYMFSKNLKALIYNKCDICALWLPTLLTLTSKEHLAIFRGVSDCHSTWDMTII